MKSLHTLILFFFCLQSALFAQTDAAKPEEKLGWKFGGGLGLDLAGTFLKNPRVGAGDNRIGVGGLVNFTANNKLAKSFWDNTGVLQLGVQRIGKQKRENPFQKNMDVLRLGSRYGYKIIGEKIFLAVDATAETQLLKTYQGNLLDGDTVLSQFLSPLRVSISPGIDYKPTAHLSFFFAPASWNLVYVNQEGLRGELNTNFAPFGNVPGKASRSQLGATLKGQYVNKFFKDRVAFSSKAAWFTSYYTQTGDAENKVGSLTTGNVLWQNSLSVGIIKGLSLDLLYDVFYDHFTQVVVNDEPYTLGLKPSNTFSFLLKYNKIF